MLCRKDIRRFTHTTQGSTTDNTKQHYQVTGAPDLMMNKPKGRVTSDSCECSEAALSRKPGVAREPCSAGFTARQRASQYL